MLPLPKLVGREAVSVGGEGLRDDFGGGRFVGGGKPAVSVEVLLDVGDLGREGLWEEEVCAVEQVFEEALRGVVRERP